MKPDTPFAFASMPPRAPLEMTAQELRRKPQHGDVHSVSDASSPVSSTLWRIALFGPAFLGTFLMLKGLYGWFAETGMSGLEWVLLTMIGLTFVWVSLSVSTIGLALAGLLASARRGDDRPAPANPLSVALLLPIYNEPTSDVFGNAAAMLDDIAARHGQHRFSLFVLSDTTDADVAAAEERAFALLKATAPAGLEVHYRRRALNTDKKVGNLVNWITGWGGAYEAMLVLDADSLMSGRAIEGLADQLACAPDVGLIQTCPVLIGADTLFARLQQFSNIAYGWLLAEGLARWARSEGNYWGHNAIIRTRAFAASAGLPYLAGRRGKAELILSHDFVEAGLLRRAGWQVRFMPRLGGSYEETPATLIDYVLRDQRWCRGNLQHLRLLGTAGLHPVSRFHLLHGAVSYLLSPAWFLLLIIWFLLGKDQETNVIRYFNEANPLFPDWPPAMSHIDSAIFLVIMYALLLTPKLVGATIIATHPKATRVYGGRRRFFAAFMVELVLSVAYAPIMMVQQTRAVLRAAFGTTLHWNAQNRRATRYPLRDVMRFHWVETTLGLVLAAGLVSGLVSLWLVPIAASLLMAVPLSLASALPIVQCLPQLMQMQSPHTLRVPSIVRKAQDRRGHIHNLLDTAKMPAE
ncbi:MAG: glucans biosynthesis glucosyltransferase MdoH [Roseobacter sp.]|jgi:membrane glycosyltransferase|nr:glucans biosynthesis glucosyltransferase MdoH [Roseobacter sp.]